MIDSHEWVVVSVTFEYDDAGHVASRADDAVVDFHESGYSEVPTKTRF